MGLIEVFDEEGDVLLFEMRTEFMPRVGETISRQAEDYFHYFQVKDVWYREEPSSEQFVPCIAVKLDE